MTPALVSPQAIPRPHVPNRTFDRVFFTAMILLLWASILFGFAKTYFLAGMVRAPLPNLLIHLHGAAFTLWMILLLVQTTLITTKKIKVHRTLGMFGFGLAVAMVGLGLVAGVDAMKRGSAPLGLDAKTFLVVPMSDMLAFSALVYFAYRMRSRPEFHKRLILISTIALVDAAVGRWPIAFFQTNPPAQDLVPLVFLLLVVAFDGLQLHRISKATLWASLWLIAIHATRIKIGFSPAWHSFADHLIKI